MHWLFWYNAALLTLVHLASWRYRLSLESSRGCAQHLHLSKLYFDPSMAEVFERAPTWSAKAHVIVIRCCRSCGFNGRRYALSMESMARCSNRQQSRGHPRAAQALAKLMALEEVKRTRRGGEEKGRKLPMDPQASLAPNHRPSKPYVLLCGDGRRSHSLILSNHHRRTCALEEVALPLLHAVRRHDRSI